MAEDRGNGVNKVEVKDTLNQAIADLRAGNKARARHLLENILAADRRNEQAWLWMSGVVTTDAERIICLDNVLTLNPYNASARKGLEQLGRTPPGLPIAPLISLRMPAHGPAPRRAFDVPAPDAAGVAVAPPRPQVADYRLYITLVIVLSLVLVCMVISIVVAVFVLAPSA
jgi:hypothetical protein